MVRRTQACQTQGDHRRVQMQDGGAPSGWIASTRVPSRGDRNCLTHRGAARDHAACHRRARRVRPRSQYLHSGRGTRGRRGVEVVAVRGWRVARGRRDTSRRVSRARDLGDRSHRHEQSRCGRRRCMPWRSHQRPRGAGAQAPNPTVFYPGHTSPSHRSVPAARCSEH